jgi:hypothetical protein
MPPFVLSEAEIQQLQTLATSRSLPHSIVQHAKIVLDDGAVETNTAIVQRMGLTGMSVGKWRKRYRELGLEAGPPKCVVPLGYSADKGGVRSSWSGCHRRPTEPHHSCIPIRKPG